MAKARALIFLALAACAAAGEPEPIATTSSAIIAGTASDEAQDSVVLVMHYDALQTGGGTLGCTGVMLTPRLVLTARHCVAVTDGGARCDSKGNPVTGGKVQSDHEASAMYAFAGKDRPDFIGGLAKASRGVEILTTGATTICDNDIAMILLERPLEGVKIAPLRLDAPARVGEKITAVGWGLTETTDRPDVRQQRTGITITAVGPDTALGPRELKTDEGACQGDSGGPAFAESGAVLGVLSRGGNGSGEQGAAACTGGENVYISVAGHADFILSGYEKAGQEPWLEGAPNPILKKLGEACAAPAECQWSLCEEGACAQDCSSAPCPGGFACVSRGDDRRCAPAEEDGGCSVAGSSQSGWILALAALLVACRRRR